MPFKTTDDSGFLPIIDPNDYRGPVHADWTWEAIHPMKKNLRMPNLSPLAISRKLGRRRRGFPLCL